jgi:molecular chaperone HtpG
LVRKYSDHIEVPVRMPKTETAKDDEGNPVEGSEVTTWETVNEATALWSRPKSEVSTTSTKRSTNTLLTISRIRWTWSHNKVEGKLEYTSLLYVPGRAPFDMFDRDGSRGVKLYVQRVFIMDDAEQFLPLYLRLSKVCWTP